MLQSGNFILVHICFKAPSYCNYLSLGYAISITFRHQRTSSSKSAGSAGSMGILVRGKMNTGGDSPSAGDIKFTSPSSSSNKDDLLEEAPELNFGGMYIVVIQYTRVELYIYHILMFCYQTKHQTFICFRWHQR